MYLWESHDTRKRYKELKRKHPQAIILLESGDDIYLTYFDSAEYLRTEFEKQYYTNAKGEAGFCIQRDWLDDRVKKLDAYAWELRKPVHMSEKVNPVKTVQKKGYALRPQPVEQKTVRSCDNCRLRKSGECSQIKNELCSSYRAIPYISREERDLWPEYGDATAIRFGEKRN